MKNDKMNLDEGKVKMGTLLTDGCRVTAIECSPYLDSADLFCYGTENKISIYGRQYDRNKGFDFIPINDQFIGSRVHCISWSPLSKFSLSELVSHKFVFAAATADFKIRYFDLDDSFTMPEEPERLDYHTNYINSIEFNPSFGHLIASTSDDLTCRVYNIEKKNYRNKYIPKISWSNCKMASI